MAKKTTTRNPEKYEYAFLLFMSNTQLKEICQKVGITSATLQKWRTQGEWEQKRAVKTVSFDKITAKILQKANEELDKEDFKADDFAKIISQLKQFKHGTTINDKVITLMEFGDWLITQIPVFPDLDGDFIKKVTIYQDHYLKMLTDERY